MNKIILVLIVLFLILSVVIVILYFLYEKPKAENIEKESEKVQLNIFTLDYDTKEPIETNVEVYQENLLYKQLTTNKEGGTEISASVNHTYYIKNINNWYNSTYYTTTSTKNLFGSNFPPQRINMYLEQPGNLTITQQGIFNLDDIITLKVMSDKRYKKVNFCIKWSINIVSVKTNNAFTLTENPDRFAIYDRCYNTNSNIINNQSILSVSLIYTKLADLNDRDYIDVTFYDTDCFNDNCIVEDINGNDIAGLDKYYRINLNSNNNI